MLKKRTLALLLSLAMLLTFMPAMAFADDTADDTADQPEAVAAEEVAVEDAAEEVAEEPAAEAETEEAVSFEALDAEEDEDMTEGVKAIKYTGPTLYFEPDQTPDEVWPYEEDVQFVITYEDGRSREVVLKTYDDDMEAFFFKDEEPKMGIDDDGEESPLNTVDLEFDTDNATVEKGLTVSFGGASTTIPIAKMVYPKPLKVEFIAPDDFAAEGRIGDDIVYNYQLFGEGNKFIITWDDGNVHTYQYRDAKDEDDEEGFHIVGVEGEDRMFYSDIKLNGIVPAGTNTLTGEVTIYNGYGYETSEVKVKVNASIFRADVEEKSYSYTGKNIKPKVVVRYFDGKSKKMKKMPAKWYTCKPKKHKAIGAYDFEVKIKKKYQAKYGLNIYGFWTILPKTPAIKKATAGKNRSMTVTWGKFSKKAQKGIDGFNVEVSDDKSFNYGSWVFEAKKGASKVTIDDLEPGTYYVRIVSYKAIGKGDGSPWESKPSKVKKVEIK